MGLADLKRLTAGPADEAPPKGASPPSRAARKFLPPGEVAPRATGTSGKVPAQKRDEHTTAASQEHTGSARNAPASQNALPARHAARIELSSDDRRLFRRLAGAVERVDTRNRRMPEASPEAMARLERLERAPRKRAEQTDTSSNGQPVVDAQASTADHGLSDADVSHLLRDDGTAFLRPGVGPDVLVRIAQGFWRLEANLDLHGLSVEQARPRLADFVTQCVAYEARCVRIVTGKGYGSVQGQSVLRDRVRSWLVGLPEVRAFAQAPEHEGGAGAIVVLLAIDARRARDRRDDPRQ